MADDNQNRHQDDDTPETGDADNEIAETGASEDMADQEPNIADSELADEELALSDEDERLPWLESSDYDDGDDSVDGARLLGLILLGLVALALLLGAIWWFSRQSTDPELSGDGSTIAAPEGPYKERPDDPGGKTFEGTGDSSFAVGDGRSREGVIADKPDNKGASAAGSGPATADKTGSSDKKKDASTAAASSQGSATSGATSGVGVQVGAYSDRKSAEAGWAKLSRQTDKLSGVSYRIVEGQADIGKVYRLQAVPGDAAAADRLCNALKSEGIACQVKR
ncbi:MAG: SPOR domain-containing protein [Sphingomonadaceae bacterium]